ncbi:MAG: hypothetical protein JXA91_07055 [Candidatus Thermoplasmatota archaeon]|nr:hypothetical protein [Candidatus Thermoplasmatota archaeon]
MKKCFIIFFISTLSIGFFNLGFLNIGATIANNHHSTNSNTDLLTDWFDGKFTGQWQTYSSKNNGIVSAYFNQLRNPDLGIFQGSFIGSNKDFISQFRGYFIGKILLGNLFQGNEKLPFCGIVTSNLQKPEITIFCLKIGLLYINGTYEASFLPPLTGHYGIGVQTFHMIDENRPENFTEDIVDDFREVMVQIWYPTKYYDPISRVDYMDYNTFQWLKGRSPIPLFTIPNYAYTYVNPHGHLSPPIAEKEGGYPVIIFSHGYDGVYQIYTSLIEDLVSNGFIVVSINHPYIAGIIVFPDGKTIYVSSIPNSYKEAEKWRSIALRSVVDDAKFVLSEIEEMNSTHPDFMGCFDLSKVGMYGHSFGGGATAICCYEDERFKAGLTLDGFFASKDISGGIKKPFLMMMAENRIDQDPYFNDIWENFTADAYAVWINGSEHYSFTDVGILLKHLLPAIPPKLLGFGDIDPKRMVNITKSIELAFFETYLKGNPINSLVVTLLMFPEIIVKSKL